MEEVLSVGADAAFAGVSFFDESLSGNTKLPLLPQPASNKTDKNSDV